ncbi:hypothetical protein STEG23_001797 [Scotinomys teguina]
MVCLWVSTSAFISSWKKTVMATWLGTKPVSDSWSPKKCQVGDSFYRVGLKSNQLLFGECGGYKLCIRKITWVLTDVSTGRSSSELWTVKFQLPSSTHK